MRTIDDIYVELTAQLAQSGGISVPEGGELSLRLRAVAAELFSLEAQTEYTARQSFPQTACGTALEQHGALRGLSRIPATKATGTLTFSIPAESPSPINVPLGTECRTTAGVAFVTAAAGSIGAGSLSCTVAAEAVSTGTSGNVAEDTVLYMVQPPVGVQQVTNAAAFFGGREAETDDELRSRILSAYRTLPNGANAAYYENRVKQFPNTAAVLIKPRNRGVGTVDVIFSTLSGIPTAQEIAAVEVALEAEREISVDLQVCAPTAVTVNVTAELTVASGYTYADVSQRAEAAVRACFSGDKLGKAVYRAGLSALLMSVEGVENCTLTAPAQDIAATPGNLPVLGTLLLSEAVE